MKTHFWKVFSVAAALIAGLTAYPGSPVQAAPKGEVVFVQATGSWEMRTAFDPHTAIGSSCTTLISLAFEGLVTKDEKGILRPALAESWKIADDWSRIDFFLRKEVKFHNGDSFSAQDVKFSLERAMREDMRFVFGPEMRRNIESVEIVDEYHVRLNLKAPYPAFFDRSFEYLAIVPKAYIEKVGDQGFAAKPVGTGPFRVVKFEREVFFEVEAVENHHRQTPHIKKLTVKVVPEHSTRLAMLKTGEADLIGLSAIHVPLVKRDPKLRVLWNQHTFLPTMVFFAVSQPGDSPFKDPRVRLATSLAIDRKGIADAVGHGALTPWGSFLAPHHPGFDPEQKPPAYDPEKAKKLLAEAGYANGFDTVLTSDPTIKEWFEAMLQQLADVGIRAKMDTPEHGTWAASFVGGKFKGIGYGSGPWWVGRSHPYVALESHIIGTWSHNLATPEVKKTMGELLNATDNEAIAKSARQVDEILLEQKMRLPLWSYHTPLGAGPRIKEFPGAPGVVFPIGFERLQINE
ncbi:MAG: ABC transporter substrate-binding protein [Syntrophales bacterium]|jgi:peptide/nickel transport system substrate-binding protein|nr:ABC transporter substrate-binding protein [Syntrophales bacterium]